MNVETVREYCLNKKGVTESFPFDDVSLVVKVMNKMFALIDLEEANHIALKLFGRECCRYNSTSD